MKRLVLCAALALTSSAFAQADKITTLKIQAWGNSAPSWDIGGNHRCVKGIKYIPDHKTRWTNIGTANEAPRYKFEVTHTPKCNATITFRWDGSPNDSDRRPDSFARVEMVQYS